MNSEVRAKEVRLIDKDGEQVGIIKISRAREMAEQADLDLVEVSPSANPPVCRIMDWSKENYHRQKKEKAARKQQRSITLKEIRLRPGIAAHDLDTKRKQTERMLLAGHRVKLSVRFKGREQSHPELGEKILTDLITDLEPISQILQPVRRAGREVSATLEPLQA
jgi:translation initiation factor IF-3